MDFYGNQIYTSSDNVLGETEEVKEQSRLVNHWIMICFCNGNLLY